MLRSVLVRHVVEVGYHACGKLATLRQLPRVGQDDDTSDVIDFGGTVLVACILAGVEQVIPLVGCQRTPCARSIRADGVRTPVREQRVVCAGSGRLGRSIARAPTEEVYPPLVGVGDIGIVHSVVVPLMLGETPCAGGCLVAQVARRELHLLLVAYGERRVVVIIAATAAYGNEDGGNGQVFTYGHIARVGGAAVRPTAELVVFVRRGGQFCHLTFLVGPASLSRAVTFRTDGDREGWCILRDTYQAHAATIMVVIAGTGGGSGSLEEEIAAL